MIADACTCLHMRTQGRFNKVYAFQSSDVVRVRSYTPSEPLLAAVYNCAPIVCRHLEAANQRLDGANGGRAIGVLVKTLLPLVGGQILDITQPSVARGLGAAMGVSIAMVLPRLTTADAAAKQLAKVVRDRKVRLDLQLC